jgi:NADPH2:quinone reductase
MKAIVMKSVGEAGVLEYADRADPLPGPGAVQVAVAAAGALFGWVREGRLKVFEGGTCPLADAARAHDDMWSRRTAGKLVLVP